MKTLVTVALVIAGAAWGQGEEKVCTPSQSCSLEGRPRVHVVVDVDEDELKREGVSRHQIKTDVELLLRKFNIVVVNLTREQAAKESIAGVPPPIMLGISVHGIEIKLKNGNGTGAYHFVVGCKVSDFVRLERNPSIYISSATTWDVLSSMGYVPKGSNQLKAMVEGIVTDKTKRFINAYLEANPK